MRAFVAIFPPLEVREALLRAAKAAPVTGGIRWVRQENVHLTLKFFGDGPPEPEALKSIHEALEEVIREREPLRSLFIGSSGLGAFPSCEKARVLWAGVGEGSSGLSAIAAEVDQALEPLGFGGDRRSYTPHATLGRVRGRPARLPAGVRLRATEFTARRLDVVESIPGPNGVAYETLQSYPFSRNSRYRNALRP